MFVTMLSLALAFVQQPSSQPGYDLPLGIPLQFKRIRMKPPINLVGVSNDTGGPLVVGAEELDALGNPVGYEELGVIPAWGSATFDVHDYTLDFDLLCSDECSVLSIE